MAILAVQSEIQSCCRTLNAEREGYRFTNLSTIYNGVFPLSIEFIPYEKSQNLKKKAASIVTYSFFLFEFNEYKQKAKVALVT